MTIELFTFITKNSADYAEYLKTTAEKFLSGKHDVKWKYIESVGAERLPSGYDFVAKMGGDAEHNSMNHALALNATDEFIEHDYVIYIDADMAIVYDGWDDVIVKELDKVACFGGSNGHGNKFQKFPTVYLFAFRSYILDSVCLQFEPSLIPGQESVNRYKIKNKKDANIFGLPIGTELKCDTGWWLPASIKEAGFEANAMPMILMTSPKSQLPFENNKHKQFCLKKPTHMCEWHYDGKLFATHKQASRNHPLSGEWGQAWKKRVELYVKHQR